ncbi:MAG: hypothetical protein AB2417_12835 [Clostridiaceae bacterium]
MQAKFLKKKIILVILSLLFSNIVVGCSFNAPPNDSDNKKNSSISKDSSKEVNATEKLGKDENYKNNISPKTDKVSGKVKLYEDIYFDDRRFGDNILTLKTFCEVVISNVTDTSFDFTVYQVDGETREKEVIFLTNTAVFTGDGTEAAFYGNDYTLHFAFPNNHGAYPVVTDIKISGFEPLEDNGYVNNGIPGHEFS